MRRTRTPSRTLEQSSRAARGRLRLASLIVVVALAGASALAASCEALAQNSRPTDPLHRAGRGARVGVGRRQQPESHL